MNSFLKEAAFFLLLGYPFKESHMMKDMRFLKVFVSYLILVMLAIAVMDFFLTPKISDIITKNIEDEMIGMAKTIALMPGDRH